MGKRQETALATKKSIIEAMRQLLQEKSADEINIEDITTKAGVAKGSFYTYFKRKEDLISEVALYKYEEIKKLTLQSAHGAYGKLSFFLNKSAEIIENGTLPIAQQWMKSVVASIDAETAGSTKYYFDRDIISEILEKAVENGELRKDTAVDIVSKNIMNSYYGAVATWCITNGKEGSLTENLKFFCDYVLIDMLENN